MKQRKSKIFELCPLSRTKKSQIQSMETIAILIVFFIIVFIGIIFYSNIAKYQIKDKIEEYGELEKIKIVQKVSSLPELQCSLNNIVEPNCLDIIKLDVGKEVVREEDYFDLFGFSTIKVRQVFPSDKVWVFYDRAKDEGDILSSYFPITLYDAKAQNHYFGVLIVEVSQ